MNSNWRSKRWWRSRNISRKNNRRPWRKDSLWDDDERIFNYLEEAAGDEHEMQTQQTSAEECDVPSTDSVNYGLLTAAPITTELSLRPVDS